MLVAANLVFLETLPPTIADITIQPNTPTSDDEVRVDASVTDSESGVREVNLLYSTDEGVNWIKLTMSRVENSMYSGTVPRQDQGANVQYYVEAFDNAGNRKDSSRHSYTVWSKEQISLWAIAVGGIILFGMLLIVVIVVVFFVRKRRIQKRTSSADLAHIMLKLRW